MLARRLQYGSAETTMNSLGTIDALELPRTAPATDVDADGSRDATSMREQAPARRWWFAFDGWRTADLDAEFVLA